MSDLTPRIAIECTNAKSRPYEVRLSVSWSAQTWGVEELAEIQQAVRKVIDYAVQVSRAGENQGIGQTQEDVSLPQDGALMECGSGMPARAR
jgi:hypothetical protein